MLQPSPTTAPGSTCANAQIRVPAPIESLSHSPCGCTKTPAGALRLCSMPPDPLVPDAIRGRPGARSERRNASPTVAPATCVPRDYSYAQSQSETGRTPLGLTERVKTDSTCGAGGLRL